jgi:hypothetical protein
MADASNGTSELHELDNRFAADCREIIESETLTAAAKKRRLDEATSRYKEERILKRRDVESRLQGHGETLYKRAYPPESDPSDPQKAILLELKRNRVRDRARLMEGQDGKLMAEYEEALRRGDSSLAKAYEEILPHVLTTEKAKEQVAKHAQEREWAGLGNTERRARQELEEYYKQHQAAGQGLALRAANRRRGYIPTEPTDTQLFLRAEDEIAERALPRLRPPEGEASGIPSWVEMDEYVELP